MRAADAGAEYSSHGAGSRRAPAVLIHQLALLSLRHDAAAAVSYTQLFLSSPLGPPRYLIIDSNGFIDPSITARLTVRTSGQLREALVLGRGLKLDASRTRLISSGHVARLGESTPAHVAVWCHVNASVGRLPDRPWRRRPGHPRIKWSDQLQTQLYFFTKNVTAKK